MLIDPRFSVRTLTTSLGVSHLLHVRPDGGAGATYHLTVDDLLHLRDAVEEAVATEDAAAHVALMAEPEDDVEGGST